MGFGLPAAIGAAAARPDKVVVDIDGDRVVRHEHSRVGDVARRAVAGQMLHFEQPIFRHGRTMGGPIL